MCMALDGCAQLQLEMSNWEDKNRSVVEAVIEMSAMIDQLISMHNLLPIQSVKMQPFYPSISLQHL